MVKKSVKAELEAFAAAFVAGTTSPATPERLREHGLQRVLARANAAETREDHPVTRRVYRNPAMLRHALIVAMAALLMMVLSTSGVYAFSLDAQPGSTLYGAKIFFERARVALSASSAGDVRLEMGFSERRMRELQEMAASGSQRGADRWLREYSRNIEGAGVLFEGMTAQEAEELAAEFQTMLDHHAHMMQGMRQGMQSGLSEPIESAFQVCDQERARMRRRCGQQETGGSGQGPGGQDPQGQGGQGNCPGKEGSSGQGEAPSAATADTPGNGNVTAETGAPAATTEEAPSGGAPDENTNPPADAPQPQGSTVDADGRDTQGTAYRGDGQHQGCMP